MTHIYVIFMQIIVPVLSGKHFYVVRIIPRLWTAEVHDSLLHKAGVQEARKRQLKPFQQKFSTVLNEGKYWDTIDLTQAPRTSEALRMVFLTKPTPREPVRQHIQIDSHSCGPFALMSIERMISARPSIAWGNEEGSVALYRRKIARDVFLLALQSHVDYV